MTLVPYFVMICAWWTSVGIAKHNRIGASGQLAPRVAMVVMLLTFPAGIGAWAYPMYELIAGDLPWWQTMGGVAVGLVCAAWIPRLLSSSSSGFILATPLAVILSVVGFAVLIASQFGS